MLFPKGQRPDAVMLRRAAHEAGVEVVHELRTHGTDDAPGGLELLRDGLTFDALGLMPQPAVPIAAIHHQFAMSDPQPAVEFEGVSLQPAPHIAAGARSLPVVRTMAGLAADLAGHLPALAGIAWPPARAAAGPDYFVSTVSAWIDGGAFPALGLTAFSPGEGGSLRSIGLAWFTGQEIEIDPALATDRAAAVRLAVRLVNHLVGRSAVAQREVMVGPAGEQLVIEPTGSVVHVRPG